jgi:hypothetical protein
MAAYYAHLVLIEVVDSASGSSIRRLFAQLHGEIVGGFPAANTYVIRIPPVRGYNNMGVLLDALRRNPIVAGASAQPYGGEAIGPPI